MPSRHVFNTNGTLTEGYGIITLQVLQLSRTLSLTAGAASHSPTRQQFPKSSATAFICIAVSQQMIWQDDCMLLAGTI
jgi:hypothetical protein